MTTQYTPTLKLALPVTGELSGTWGSVVNDNITSMIEQAIAGLSTINTWTSNSHTLTTANGTTSESRCAMLVAATGGGAPTAAAEIICPASAKLYVVQNTTSFAVTLKTSAGTGVAVAAGNTAFLFCDGTNVNSCVTTIVNGNVTGNLTVGGNLTVDGNTTLGNATTDTITATGRFATDLLPSTDNSRDLGSAANSWKDLYIDGTATIGLATIIANSSSAALRVTQTGAGNALLVEDSANPDSTPFVIDQFGVVVSGNTTPVTATLGPRIQAQVIDATAGFSSIRFSADGGGVQNVWAKSRGALGTNTIVASGDIIGTLNFSGADGTNYIQAATITAAVDATPGTNDMPGRLVFSTTADGASTPTERMRITSAGVFGFNSINTSGGGSGAYRFAGDITGNVNSNGVLYTPTLKSDVTTSSVLFQTTPSTEDVAFTLTTLTHYIASQGTLTGGSRTAPTNQVGFNAASSLIGATNNYGFKGDIPIGTGRYNLYAQGTADNYMAGSLGIGTITLTGYTLRLNKTITGAVTSYAIWNGGTIQSDVTASAYYSSTSNTAASTTLSVIDHYQAQQGTFAGTSVTNQRGFRAMSTLTGATNNFGFVSEIPASTGDWNFYASGTAENYMAGSLGIGSTGLAGYSLRVSKTITGASISYGVVSTGQVQSDVTSATYFYSGASSNTGTALGTLIHYFAVQGTLSGTSTTNQFGFRVDSSLTGATNNYGFHGNVPAGSNRWNFYAEGTANNYMAGNLWLGSTAPGFVGFANYLDITGATTAYANASNPTIRSGVTTNAVVYNTFPSTEAASFTLGNLAHYKAEQGTFGAGSTVTSQIGFTSGASMIGATNNFGHYAADTAAVTAGKTSYGFYSIVNTASGGGTAYGFYAAGTAPNVFNNLGVTTTLGYTTGGGGVVTQGTSRTTAVTLNKASGQITMFTAAGSASWATFQVNNSLVAATDTVVLSVNGATNSYVMSVSSIAAGAFTILFSSVIGTASDTPKINFTVIKGATS